MDSWRNKFLQYKSISWLMATLLLLMIFIPAHYHLHNDEHEHSTLITHAHSLDLHVSTDQNLTDHGHNHNTDIVTINQDILFKKDNPVLFPALFLALTLLFGLLTYHSLLIKPQQPSTIRKHRCLFFTPLLRAPPAH